MDYLQNLFRLVLTAICLIVLNGCSGDSDSSEPQVAVLELSPEPLEILGFSPEHIYYDSPISINFGATGGSGDYQLRYIKNVEADEDSQSDTANPLDMYVNDVSASEDNNDAIKPSFQLEGVLDSSGLLITNGETSGAENFSYGLELTDGINTVSETYDVQARLNTVYFRDTPKLTEATPFETSYNNLLNAYHNGDQAVCSSINDVTIGRRKVNGVYVYPAVFVVQLDAPVSKRTTLYYKTTSTYIESRAERYISNIRNARPDVDFISIAEDEGAVVFEAGQSACFVQVDIIDDDVIEETETFKIEFTRVEGSALAFTSANKQVELRDNEPKVAITPVEALTNEGNSYSVPVFINTPHPTDLEVAISIDSSETSASQSDYSISPSNGVLVIPAGTFSSAFTIDILDDKDLDDAGKEQDEKLVVRTDLDDILDIEPSTITINDWVDSERIAGEKEGVKVVDFAIDSLGNVISLLSDTSGSKEFIRFDVRNRSGDSVSNGGLADLVLEHADLDITPMFIESDDANSGRIAVIASIEGAYQDTHFGKSDFVVFTLFKDDQEQYRVESVGQFGTEEDDLVSGVKVYDSLLYVSGKTSGLRLNGVAADVANSGGSDGFIYKLGLSSSSVVWSRFVGSSEDEALVSIDVGNRDLIYLTSTNAENMDGAVGIISADTKFDRENITPPSFSSIYDDYVKAIRYDSNSSGFYVLVDGLARASSGSAISSTLTSDINLYLYDSELELDGSISFGSKGEDVATTMITSLEDDYIIVGGYTDDSFDEQVSKGAEDAFIAVLSKSGSSSRQTLSGLTQFGTSSDDRVITVKQYSDEKFMVLWSETATDPGQNSYRISAFSLEGEQLSDLP